MSMTPSIKKLKIAFFLILSLSALSAYAGGITLGGTRVVYQTDGKLYDLSVRNSSEKSTYLVQSWIENSKGEKQSDFIVAPPLYVSAPGNENALRLIYAGKTPAQDRETLYYLNVKAIPSVDKEQKNSKNMLVIAAVTRIKVFLRPSGLSDSIAEAPEKLIFTKQDGRLVIKNPTPYFITLTNVKVGGKKLSDFMVYPYDSLTQVLPQNTMMSSIDYKNINDYGALSKSFHVQIK